MTAPESSVGTKVKKHEFHEALHHPVIQVAQHVISPLTGSLLIFACHKAWQVKGGAAMIHAAWILIRARHLSEIKIAVKDRLPKLALSTAGAATLFVLYQQRPLPSDNRLLEEKLRNIYHDDDVSLVTQSLKNWWTKDYVVWMLTSVHEKANLPWWMTIVSVTVGLRVVLAFVNILLLRNSLRLKFVFPEMEHYSKLLLSKEKLQRHTKEQKVGLAAEYLHILHKHKCSPWSLCIAFPILMPPCILSVFGAIDELCLSEPSMLDGGCLWFQDLIARDETSLLPIISALTWIWQVELGAGMWYAANPHVRLTARLGAIGMISLSSTLPSGVFLFWITSNMYAVVRSYMCRMDIVRKLWRMPLRRDVAKLPHIFGHKYI